MNEREAFEAQFGKCPAAREDEDSYAAWEHRRVGWQAALAWRAKEPTPQGVGAGAPFAQSMTPTPAVVGQMPEPVARLLTWSAPSNIPAPHGGVCARTFKEYPPDTPADNRYWFEGEPLVLASQMQAVMDSAYIKGKEETLDQVRHFRRIRDERDAMQIVVDAARLAPVAWDDEILQGMGMAYRAIKQSLAALDALRKKQGNDH